MQSEILRRLKPYLACQFSRDIRELLEDWWQDFKERSAELEFADKPLAQKLYRAACEGLGRDCSDALLLQAAILYLVEHDDEEHDLESPLGMEDDAEVWNAVCDELGWADLRVP
jgi:hypothetical protein